MICSKAIKRFSDGDQDYDLWLLLMRTKYAVYRARELELSRYGLTPEQAQILAIIHASKEDNTPATIARVTLLRPNTISAILERMRKKGLLKKARDLKPKNQVRVCLTKKGEEAHRLSSKRGPIHRIMKVVNQEEREIFNRLLEKLLVGAGQELGLNRDRFPSSE